MFFWFFCAMRVGAFLIALRTQREGLDLSSMQQNFFQRGIAVDRGIALIFTAMWLAALFRERTKRTLTEAKGH